MKKYLVAIIMAMLTIWLALSNQALAQQPVEPLTVMQAYDVALSTGDVEAALALFADDAVLNVRQGQLIGKEQIRTWLAQVVAQNSRIEVVDRQVEGDKVTWRTLFFRKDIESSQNEPLEANAEAIVQDGQIKSFSSLFTPEAQARLDAALPAQAETAPTQAETTPAQLPTTGAAQQSGRLLPTMLSFGGLLFVVAGLIWWRRQAITE
jgi:ketosteroid isomerase-like protein